MYKCSICGKEYESVVDRANCEISCTKKIETENKIAEAAKKQEEAKADWQEIEDLGEILDEKIEAYTKKYGKHSLGALRDKAFTPSKELDPFAATITLLNHIF